jgi:hypothetical protein
VLSGVVAPDHDETNHFRLLALLIPDDNSCITNCTVVEHGMLHFGWLDTVASDLDLLIHAPKKFQLAVRPSVSHAVARSVRPDEPAVDGDLDEPVAIQFRVSIPSSKSVSCDNELSHHPDRDELLLRIHNVGSRIANCHPDRNAIHKQLLLGDVVDSTDNCVLGGTIRVVNASWDKRLYFNRIATIESSSTYDDYV